MPDIDPTTDPDGGGLLAGVDVTTATGGTIDDAAPLPDLGDLSALVRPDDQADEPDDQADEQAAPPDGAAMGVSSAYFTWLAAGRPWEVAYPVADLCACLRSHGYTVYLLGNLAHLTAGTPEDHTPFSATGWPDPSARWWVHALDVMPPPAGSGLPSLAQLAAQIRADKLAGIAGASWVKYLNWTDAAGDCWHDSWQPGYARRSSSDHGHIHGSGRTDYRLSRVAAGYDPVARFRAAGGVVIVPAAYHPVTESATYPPFPGRTLAYNGVPRHTMHGADVHAAQQRLRDRGWSIRVDDFYGPKTAAVVGRFQRDSTRHGWPLAVDGELGPLTWRAMWLRPRS